MSYYKLDCKRSNINDLTLDEVKRMVIESTLHMDDAIIKLYSILEVSIKPHVLRSFSSYVRFTNREWNHTDIYKNSLLFINLTRDDDDDYFIELSCRMTHGKDFHVTRQLRMPSVEG